MSAIIKNIKEFKGLNSVTYPIGVEAKDVVLTDGSYLEDALGDINFFQNGSVIDQIKEVVPSTVRPTFTEPTLYAPVKITNSAKTATYATINSNGYNGVIYGTNSPITLPLILKSGGAEKGRISSTSNTIQYLFPTNGILEIYPNTSNPKTKVAISSTEIRLTGPTYINSTIVVGVGTNGVRFNQAARFVKHVYLDSTTSFGNTATFNKALVSNNTANFNNGLTVAANKTATINGALSVHQNTTLTGSLTANGGITAAGLLWSRGTTCLETITLDKLKDEEDFLQNSAYPPGLYPVAFSESYSHLLRTGKSTGVKGGAMNGFLLKGATLGTNAGSASTRSIIMNYEGNLYIRTLRGTRATKNGKITWEKKVRVYKSDSLQTR